MIFQGNIGQYIKGFSLSEGTVEINYKILVKLHVELNANSKLSETLRVNGTEWQTTSKLFFDLTCVRPSDQSFSINISVEAGHSVANSLDF